MIERLSDEVIKAEFIKRFIESGSFCDFCRRWEESAKFARDYYDAQIDKQAKTMEELERIYRDNFYSCGSNEAFKYARLKGYDKRQVNAFEGMVSCFLAAGGTIKDGE